MQATVLPVAALTGHVDLPPDKSIAHRAAMLAALADGTSRILGYSPAADPQSTLAVLRQLGIEIEGGNDRLVVHGRGLHGLSAPTEPLDCGNSGTTMRLMAGVLAGQPFSSTLTGDASLSRRPMERIAAPLRLMQAEIGLNDGHAPLRFGGGDGLRGITYPLPVASAQVKSCVLLAGLYADRPTTVVESTPSRDHTERMLGLAAHEQAGTRHLTVTPGMPVAPRTWVVPRDFSAAAFFLVAGSIAPEGSLRLPAVGVNPTRTALLDVLREMGASIAVENERIDGGEPVADLTVRPAPLRGVTVARGRIPNLIDEVPVLAVAACRAEGRTEIRNARELRVKETDRIDAVVRNLRALGAEVEEFEDGLAVTGPCDLAGATVESFDDHRIAMAMGVAGLVARNAVTIREADCARISFPGFWDVLGHISVR